MEKHPTAAEEVELSDDAKGRSPLAPPEDSGAGLGAAAVELVHGSPGTGIGHYRWVICGLLFFATTVNYVDRSVLAVLSPLLQKQIGWTNTQYGNINAAFSAAYAIGLLFAGNIIDRLGTRLGYPLFMALWGISSICHVFVSTVMGFGIVRVFLGLFESGNFPAAVKTVAEWYPKRERSLAIGLFNSGSNLGAIFAPIIVPVVTLTATKWTGGRISWQAAFCVTGVLELIWIVWWLSIYRRPEEHPRVSKAELNYILSDPAEKPTKVPWARLLPYPQTWAFSIGKFLTDPVWWFWLFWAAPYLNHKFGVDIKSVGKPLIVIYCLASVGSIGGGWMASVFVRMGSSMNVARKMSLLLCGLCVVPVVIAPTLHTMWPVVLLIGLAAAAHQGFSANLFALSGDLFPRRVVGSVVGIGGLAGGVGGIIIQWAAGRIVDLTGTYLPLFIFAASAYVVAVAIIQVLAPRLEVAAIDGEASHAF